jgi:hypothetical protein
MTGLDRFPTGYDEYDGIISEHVVREDNAVIVGVAGDGLNWGLLRIEPHATVRVGEKDMRVKAGIYFAGRLARGDYDFMAE